MNKILTTRFGEVDMGPEHLIHFEDGIIGFSALQKYVLVESPSMPLVLWLQSIDAPDIAFPLIEPWFFKRDYKTVMTDADRHTLGFVEGDVTKTFNILTIPEDMPRMTVNMKAPIILDITRSTGAQVILQDKALDVRTPAHEAFTRALSSFPTSQSVSTVEGEEQEESWVAVDVRGRVSASASV